MFEATVREKPMAFSQAAEDFQRVERAIHFLETHIERQPELYEVAAAVNMSEYHFQRLFSRWVGISPKRFLQFLTREHARKLLTNSHNVLDAALDSGLTGPSRLHDLFVKCDAVTPGEIRSGGVGLTINYGFHPTPFGECLIAVSARGITDLVFLTPEIGRSESLANLRKHWNGAQLLEDAAATRLMVEQIFHSKEVPDNKPLHVLFSGTNFQMKVWEALLKIPSGHLVSYQDIATAIDKPKAVRAVASAIANNSIAYLVPCHRVIRKIGEINQYRWGASRKKAMVGWESAQRF
ncbi:MAG: methylated-DNA--[protein]-cysteine S-methyltransferase [Calditrichia bacterium]